MHNVEMMCLQVNKSEAEVVEYNSDHDQLDKWRMIKTGVSTVSKLGS